MARIADADGGFFSIDLSRKHYKGSFSTFPSDDLQLILNIVASEKSAEKEKTATENVEQAAVPLSEKESRHLMNIHVRQNVYCLGLTIGKLALKVGIDKYNSFIGKMIHPECFKRPTIEDVSMHLFLNNLCTRVQ